MPKFSQASFSQLSTCHMDLQVIFFEVIKHTDCAILEGYRNQEDQDRDFRDGKSKLKWPDSKHNRQPSIAVDVTPFPVDWENIPRFYWFGGYVMGIAAKLKDEGKITHALRYGGSWNGENSIGHQKFNDLVHFELIV